MGPHTSYAVSSAHARIQNHLLLSFNKPKAFNIVCQRKRRKGQRPCSFEAGAVFHFHKYKPCCPFKNTKLWDKHICSRYLIFFSASGALSFPTPHLSKTCLPLIFHRLSEDLSFQEKQYKRGSEEWTFKVKIQQIAATECRTKNFALKYNMIKKCN